MKTTRRVLMTPLVASVAAVAGVVVAHGSAARRAARPRVGTVVARIPILSTRGRWTALLALTATLAAAGATTLPATAQGVTLSQLSEAEHAAPAINQVCTIASLPQRATIEVAIPNAGDFCELLSQALATEVFRGPTAVVPGVLWDYAGSTQTCDLKYRRTSYEIVVGNSRAACAWLTRPGTGWHAAAPNRAGNTPRPALSPTASTRERSKRCTAGSGSSRSSRPRLGLRGEPVRLAAGLGSLWVRDDSGRVLRIEP